MFYYKTQNFIFLIIQVKHVQIYVENMYLNIPKYGKYGKYLGIYPYILKVFTCVCVYVYTYILKLEPLNLKTCCHKAFLLTTEIALSLFLSQVASSFYKRYFPSHHRCISIQRATVQALGNCPNVCTYVYIFQLILHYGQLWALLKFSKNHNFNDVKVFQLLHVP